MVWKPDPIQPVGNREAHANAAHQHQPAHSMRIANGERQRDTAAKRVAHQISLFDAQCIEHADGMLDPDIALIIRVGRALAVTEAQHVGGNDPALFGQLGHHQTPVGPGGDARPGAVNQHQREAFAMLMQIGLVTAGDDAAAQLGTLYCHIHKHLTASRRCFSFRCRTRANAPRPHARCPTVCCHQRRYADRAGTSCLPR